MITKYTSRTSQFLPSTLLFLTLSLSVQAQPVTGVLGQDPSTLGTWRQTVGEQHAAMLRSRDDALRVTAMQNVIVLSTQRAGELDLTPVVPVLLDIYADDANDAQQRIMAVVALRAVADKSGMNELYRLTEAERYASPASRIAQNAVRHYYAEQAMEREEARAAYFLAKGDLKKAEKHAARAAAHRSKLG